MAFLQPIDIHYYITYFENIGFIIDNELIVSQIEKDCNCDIKSLEKEFLEKIKNINLNCFSIFEINKIVICLYRRKA
jgi:hypothetical protein